MTKAAIYLSITCGFTLLAFLATLHGSGQAAFISLCIALYSAARIPEPGE